MDQTAETVLEKREEIRETVSARPVRGKDRRGKNKEVKEIGDAESVSTPARKTQSKPSGRVSMTRVSRSGSMNNDIACPRPHWSTSTPPSPTVARNSVCDV